MVRRKGFTLIEALLALMITAGILLLFQGLTASLRTGPDSEWLAAQQTLESLTHQNPAYTLASVDDNVVILHKDKDYRLELNNDTLRLQTVGTAGNIILMHDVKSVHFVKISHGFTIQLATNTRTYQQNVLLEAAP